MEFDLNLNDHSDCCVENGLEGREVLRVIHVSTYARYGELCKLEGTRVTCPVVSLLQSACFPATYSQPKVDVVDVPNGRRMEGAGSGWMGKHHFCIIVLTCVSPQMLLGVNSGLDSVVFVHWGQKQE